MQLGIKSHPLVMLKEFLNPMLMQKKVVTESSVDTDAKVVPKGESSVDAKVVDNKV